RLVALDAGDIAQAGDDAVAERDVLGAHVVDAFLATGKRGDGGLLHDGRWIRGGLTLQFLDGRRNGRGRERIAEAPSRHGIRLRERADDEDVFFRRGELADGGRLAGVVEIDVALVGDDVDALLVRELDDGVLVGGGHHRARRVRGRVQD